MAASRSRCALSTFLCRPLQRYGPNTHFQYLSCKRTWSAFVAAGQGAAHEGAEAISESAADLSGGLDRVWRGQPPSFTVNAQAASW